MRRGEAFELGGGEGDCGIGAVDPGRLAPLTAPDTLRAGQELRAGQWLLSKNRQWGLTVQAADANVVLYNQADGNGYWGTGALGPNLDPKLAMQTDGNLVVYARGRSSLWNTETYGQGPSVYLVMQNDGNLVLYRGSTPLWHANTVGGVAHDDSSFLEDVASTFADVVTFIAPFAETALSFIPGIGTVASAAIAAGISLAEGNNISDALLDGTKAALPGGPLVKAAFDVGVGIVKGESVSTIALETARKNLPGGPAAVAAFDVAVSLAVGQQVQQGNIAAVETSGGSSTITIVPSAPVGPPPLLAPFLQRNKAQAMGVSIRSGPNLAALELVLTDKRKAELAAQKKARKVGAAALGAGALGAAAWWFLL